MRNALRISWLALAALMVSAATASEQAPKAELVEKGAVAAGDEIKPAAAKRDTEAEPIPVLSKDLPRLNLSSIESIAIQDNGRKKPFHTLAHESIEQIVGRPLFGGSPRYADKKSGVTLYSTDLYLSIWLHPEYWSKQPIILVAYGPLRKELGLEEGEKRFSLERLQKCEKILTLAQSARELRRAKRDTETTDMQKEAEIVLSRISLFSSIQDSFQSVNLIPHPAQAGGKWKSLAGWRQDLSDPEGNPYYPDSKFRDVAQKFADVATAYQKQDASAFASSSEQLRGTLAAMSPIYPAFGDLEREVGYNKLRPFGLAWICYLLAFVLGLIALKVNNKGLYYGMLGAYLTGMGIHTYGIILRCLIAGRPPVSNMYESVIWVGFGSVAFGLIFEMIYRKKFYVVSGSVGGFLCLVLMDLMPVMVGNAKAPGAQADIGPLVPVLRDNFWLTVHVLTITLSYAAFMLAWVLGHVTLASHLFRPGEKHEHNELHQFVYRAMQVGVLLVAIGTILGGVWAYYSWGRFWGWDPKETWAFITLMCYIVALHGRFAGWWGSFGISVAAVVCFQAVVMAWYGVNFVLGNGLHAYASGAGGEQYAIALVVGDAIFTGLAIQKYLSYRGAEIDE